MGGVVVLVFFCCYFLNSKQQQKNHGNGKFTKAYKNHRQRKSLDTLCGFTEDYKATQDLWRIISYCQNSPNILGIELAGECEVMLFYSMQRYFGWLESVQHHVSIRLSASLNGFDPWHFWKEQNIWGLLHGTQVLAALHILNDQS